MYVEEYVKNNTALVYGATVRQQMIDLSLTIINN
jgi:hypothetical protein